MRKNEQFNLYCPKGHLKAGGNLLVVHGRTQTHFRCKACAAESRRNYYEKNIEKEKRAARTWQLENAARNTENKRVYRESHKAETAVYNHWYEQTHLEEIKKRQRERYVADEFYRTRINQRNRDSYASNPEPWLSGGRAKRARERSNGFIDVATIRIIKAENALWFGKLTCEYCQEPIQMGRGKWHLDHIFPSARGGDNKAVNLCIACATCNKSKRDLLLSDWLRRTAGLCEENVRLAIRVQAEMAS